MRKVQVALVEGDGSAPEMMKVACAAVVKAAKKDNVAIEFMKTPMGWAAYEEFGDTLPRQSLKVATDLGLLFFGGVGEKELDKTLGVEHPEMMPEARCLLTIRQEWGLLVNERPAIFRPELRHLTKVRESAIPDSGVRQIWLRYLLEDTYFGNRHFIDKIGPEARRVLGLKMKHQVTGKEQVVSDIGYYTKRNLFVYFRYAFARARELHVPLICVDKKNVMARYVFWRMIAEKIHKREFPDVEMRCHYSDDATGMLVDPASLDGVIVCGNEHGDNLSDGALKVVGSMGLMYSSAINLRTGKALFESGAGTYPEAKGKNIANPSGRVLAGGLLLSHIGAVKGAEAIEKAVWGLLSEGYRTEDLLPKKSGIARLGYRAKVLGTREMGDMILSRL